MSLGWLSGWAKRVKIIIDQDDITAALENFPVLIYLSADSGINDDDISFIFDELGANSLKIAVTEDDGTTECYVEVEKWDLGNEEAWLWAKVPAIASGADTDIYLYFDNDHADNNAHVGATNSVVAENVWDANFLMVQHQAGAASPIRDSTSNDVDMTEKSDPIYQQAGQIDGAIDYDENDCHFSAVDVFDAIVGTGKGTIGFWIKTTTETASTNHYAFSIEGGYVIQFNKLDNDGKLRIFWSGAGVDFVKTNTVINDGNWHYVVTTYDGANQLAYVAGNFENTDVCNLFDITGLTRASRIATQWDWSAGLAAVIDEVRVSKVNRSAAWIKASYETGRDDLLDYGSEEIGPALTLTETLSLSDVIHGVEIMKPSLILEVLRKTHELALPIKKAILDSRKI